MSALGRITLIKECLPGYFGDLPIFVHLKTDHLLLTFAGPLPLYFMTSPLAFPMAINCQVIPENDQNTSPTNQKLPDIRSNGQVS